MASQSPSLSAVFIVLMDFGIGTACHHNLYINTSYNACLSALPSINKIQLSTTDLLAFASMKNAAKARNVM